MERYFKEKRILYLLRKVHDVYYQEKIIKIKPKDFNRKEIAISKGRTIPINQSKPNKIYKMTKYYYHDIVDGAPIPFNPQDPIITPEQLNTLLNDNMVKELNQSMIPKPTPIKDILMYIALGSGITGFIMMILIYLGVF